MKARAIRLKVDLKPHDVVPVLVILVLLTGGWEVANAQVPGSRYVTIRSEHRLFAGMFELEFTHRFSQVLKDASLNDLYGLDSFAYTGLGLQYALSNRLSVGVYRTALEKNIEFHGLLDLYTGRPFRFGGRAAVMVNTDEGTNDPFRAAIQVLAGGTLGRFDFTITPGWVSNPARVVAADKTTLAVTIGVGLRVTRGVTLVGEISPVIAGYRLEPQGGDYHPSWGAGVQISVGDGGHVFTLLVTNQIGATLDQVLPGSGDNRLRLGFNLIRRI